MNQYHSAIITGASSGIGEEMAKQLSHNNMTLCLIGRNKERLNHVKDACELLGAHVEVYSEDVSNKEAIKKIILDFNQKFPVDLIFANAGIGTTQSEDQNAGVVDTQKLIDTNICGIHSVIDPLIPIFKERKSGQIAIMSSIAAYRGFAKHYIYAATKAYGRIYGEGLRLDLKKEGIQVSVIAPGFVKTRLTDKNKFKMPLIINADKACKIILKGLEKNKPIISFPKIFYFIVRFISALPVCIANKISEKIA